MTVTTSKPTSLVDIISSGYGMLNRRIWVLLFPLMLDLYLWLGAPILPTPLLNPLLESIREQMAQIAAQVEPEQRFAWDELRETTRTLEQSDIRGALTIVSWLPTFLTEQALAPTTQPGYALERVATLVAVVLALNIGALVLSCFYLVPLAHAIRAEPTTVRTLLADAWRLGVGIACYVALIIGTGFTLGLPLLLLIGILSALMPVIAVGASVLLGLLIQFAIFWAYLYLGFAVEAMLVDRLGPFRALGSSFRLVSRNFWSALGLIALAFLISQGLLVFWLQIDAQPAGLLIAMLGSAYIGSGLTAARMAFYKDRTRTITTRI